MKKLFLAIGLSVLAFAPLAQAKEPAVRIQVFEADLASEASLANLYERIENAAQAVCNVGASPLHRAVQCRREAVADAVRAAGFAQLAAYHIAMTTRPPEEATSVAMR